MDRNVLMTFDDFVTINTELLEKTGLALYRAESYEHPFVRITDITPAAWADSGLRALTLLIGHPQDESRLFGPPSFDVKRNARVGFVDISYGGDDEYAIGATHYGADGSDTMKLVNRELNKLLKKHAHQGVVDAGRSSKLLDHYYWTDAALASGKNWCHFLGTGVRKDENKMPGYRPKPE